MSNYGIKISKRGFDARTAENKDLLMTTELPIYKTVASGPFSITIPGGSSSPVDFVINHALPYRADSIITIEHQIGSAVRRIAQVLGVAGGAGDDIYSMELKGIGTTTIRAYPLGVDGADRTYNGYYFIFYDPSE